MKRILAAATSLVFAVSLVSCSDGEVNANVDASSSSNETLTSSPSNPVEKELLQGGDSFLVPCDYSASMSCMEIELIGIESDAQCETYDDSAEGRYVALSLKASMPDDADSNFISPFASFPWRASTADGMISNIDHDVSCEGGETILDLMEEFPGYSAEGIAYLPVDDDVDTVHFDVGTGENVRIDVSRDSGVAFAPMQTPETVGNPIAEEVKPQTEEIPPAPKVTQQLVEEEPYVVECLEGTPGPSLMSDGTITSTDYCFHLLDGPAYLEAERQSGLESPAPNTPSPWVQGQIDWMDCLEAGNTEDYCRETLN